MPTQVTGKVQVVAKGAKVLCTKDRLWNRRRGKITKLGNWGRDLGVALRSGLFIIFYMPPGWKGNTGKKM